MASVRPSFYRRITASVPLLITVIVHIVLVAIAGYFVTERITGKKKTFEASAASDSPAMKQVEHRIQIARKGGGSATSSPVSVSRIFSTADSALQLPAMPDLPSVGASSLTGMGFGKGVGAMGAGTGYNTGLGSGASLGRGFMSMSFLGLTNQRVSKVVFVVDISPGLMDIRKGGFRAFEILRQEIARLVGNLHPTSQFNVVLYDGGRVRLFSEDLTLASVVNKTAFMEWLTPINASLDSLGARSIPASSPNWTYKRNDNLKLDPEYNPPPWVQAVQAAIEQKPATIFLITGSAPAGQIRYSAESIAKRRAEKAKHLEAIKASGLDIAGIIAARNKALNKLRGELNAINDKLIAAKKDPFVVSNIQRVLQGDFKEALKRAGFPPLKLDTSGWQDKEGNPIWNDFSSSVATSHNAEFDDVLKHIALLQYGLITAKAALNVFLFVGPEEKAEQTQKNLSTLASKNGGKFNLLTTKRLEEITRRSQ